jgi:hypothetical protein
MWDRIAEIALSLPTDAPLEGRLPSDGCVIEVEGRLILGAVDSETSVGIALLGCVDPEIARCTGHMATYWKRTPDIVPSDKFCADVTTHCPSAPKDGGEGIAALLTERLDLLFSFMAEPRFVKQTPVSRARRQMAAKKIGQKALNHTWVKVGWTVGSSVRAKGNTPGSAPQKAYHMVRAHWRKYDRQTAKSERRPHRPGWWVWIDAHYSGNPALGEIKHSYQPKLDDPGKSSRAVHGIVAARIAEGLAL